MRQGRYVGKRNNCSGVGGTETVSPASPFESCCCITHLRSWLYAGIYIFGLHPTPERHGVVVSHLTRPLSKTIDETSYTTCSVVSFTGDKFVFLVLYNKLILSVLHDRL